MSTLNLFQSRSRHPTIRVHYLVCSLNMSLDKARDTKHTIHTCSPMVTLMWLSHGYSKALLMYLCASFDSSLLGRISLTSLQSLKMCISLITRYPPLANLAWPPYGMTHIHRLFGIRPLYQQKSRLSYPLISSGFTESFLHSQQTCHVYLFEQEALHWFTTYIVFSKS